MFLLELQLSDLVDTAYRLTAEEVALMWDRARPRMLSRHLGILQKTGVRMPKMKTSSGRPHKACWTFRLRAGSALLIRLPIRAEEFVANSRGQRSLTRQELPDFAPNYHILGTTLIS